MKYLFLDMDGVLNSTQSSIYFWRTMHNRMCFISGFEELCPIACSNLNHLLEKFPEAKVVISSTWRLHFKITEWGEKMKDICPAIVGRVIDRTPRLGRLTEGVQRGEEIYKWLEDNGALNDPYLVLDDDSDMDKVRANFIKTDPNIGLSWNNIMEAFIRFGVSP